MSSETCTLTLEAIEPFPAGGQPVPAWVRMRRGVKYLLRWQGFRAVVDWKYREKIIEECYRILCPICREGKPVGRNLMGVWVHNRGQDRCMAHALREGLYRGETNG